MCRMCCIFTILSPTGSSRDSCAACVVFLQYFPRQVHQGIHVPHVLYFYNTFPDRFIKGFMCRMCCIFTILSPTGSSRDSCAACVVFSQYSLRQVHQGIHVPHVLYFHNMFSDRFIKGFMCRKCCIFTMFSRQIHQGIHVPHVLYFHNMFSDRFIKGFMCRMCCIFTICSPIGSSRDSCAECVVFSQYVLRQVHQGIHVPHVLYFHNMFSDRFIKVFMCHMCCIFTICSPTDSSRDSCAACVVFSQYFLVRFIKGFMCRMCCIFTILSPTGSSRDSCAASVVFSQCFLDRFIKGFMCRMCCIFTICSPTGSSRDSCAACVVFSQYVLRQVHQGIHVPNVLYFHNMFSDRFIKGFMCRMCCIFTICSPTDSSRYSCATCVVFSQYVLRQIHQGIHVPHVLYFHNTFSSDSSRDSCAACVVFSQYFLRQVHQGIHVPHVLYFHNTFSDRFIKGFMCRMCCIFTILSPTDSSRDSCAACVVFSQYFLDRFIKGFMCRMCCIFTILSLTGSSRGSCAACVVFSQYFPRQVHQGIHVPHVLYFHNTFSDRFIKGFMCRMCCIFTILSPTDSSRDSCAACVVFSQYVLRQIHQGIHVPHVLYFHNTFSSDSSRDSCAACVVFSQYFLRQVHQGIHVPHVLYFHNTFSDRFIKGFMCRMCCIFTILSPTDSSRDSCAACVVFSQYFLDRFIKGFMCRMCCIFTILSLTGSSRGSCAACVVFSQYFLVRFIKVFMCHMCCIFTICSPTDSSRDSCAACVVFSQYFLVRFIKGFMCRMCCIFTILSPTGSSRDSCAACVVFSQYFLRQIHQGIHVPHVLYFHNTFSDRFIKGFMCRMCCIFTILSRQIHQGIHVPHVLYFHNTFPDRFIKGFMCRMCCIFTILSPTGSSRDSCAACVVFSQYFLRQVHQGIHVPHVLYFHNTFSDRFIKGFMCRMCCIFTILSRQIHQGIHVPHVLYFHNTFPDRFIKGFMCRMCCIFTILSPTDSSRDSCAASSRSARRTATSSSTPRLTTWRDCAELSRGTCSTRSGYLPRNSCTKYDRKQIFYCTAHSF